MTHDFLLEKIPLRTLFLDFCPSGSPVILSFLAAKTSKGIGTMSGLNVDEFYSASPTPEEDNTQEDMITVEVSRNVLALLKKVQDVRNVVTTQVKDKTETKTSSSKSPYTPDKFSTSGDVTDEEIEALINQSQNVVLSDCKNTNLGDTRSKETPVNVSDSSNVENSLVDSAIVGHQDGNESSQDSPVSVKDAPGKAAPFKRVMGPENASSAQQGLQTQQPDLPYDVSGATTSIYVEGVNMEEVKKITDMVQKKGITAALRAGKGLRPKIVVNGTKYAVLIRLICGDKLSEKECLDLTSVLVAISTKLYKSNAVVVERLQTITDFRRAPPNIAKLFESILSIAQREFTNALEELCAELKCHALQQDMKRLAKDLETNGVRRENICNGADSKLFQKFMDLVWKQEQVSDSEFKALVKAYNAKVSRTMTLSTVRLQYVSELMDEYTRLVQIADYHKYYYDRLLKTTVAGRELLREHPTDVPGILIKDILMKEHIRAFVEYGEPIDNTAMTEADNAIKDTLKANSTKVENERTLVMKERDQDNDDGSANDDERGGAKITRKVKPRGGCTNLQGKTRSQLQQYIFKKSHKVKAKDGKRFCISYNLARHSFGMNHEDAEQACHDYHGPPSRGQSGCGDHCSHTLMDVSECPPEQSDGGKETNDP